MEHTQPMYNGVPVRISSRRFKRPRNPHQRHRNLKYVKIVGREPSKPQQIPQCLVLNARSIVKADAFSALYADIKSDNIDICCTVGVKNLSPLNYLSLFLAYDV